MTPGLAERPHARRCRYVTTPPPRPTTLSPHWAAFYARIDALSRELELVRERTANLREDK